MPVHTMWNYPSTCRVCWSLELKRSNVVFSCMWCVCWFILFCLRDYSCADDDEDFQLFRVFDWIVLIFARDGMAYFLIENFSCTCEWKLLNFMFMLIFFFYYFSTLVFSGLLFVSPTVMSWPFAHTYYIGYLGIGRALCEERTVYLLWLDKISVAKKIVCVFCLRFSSLFV